MANVIIKRTWRIYKATCLVTNKSYIGLTVNSISQRWSNHVCQAKANMSPRSFFHRAVRKYGKEAFSIECIMQADSLAAACLAERGAILAYSTLVPDGYNISSGGAGTPGVRRSHSEATKTKISTSNLGKTFSEETRQKMSIAKKKIGMNRAAILASVAARKEKPFPVEVARKISESHTGKTRPLRSISLLKRYLEGPTSNCGVHKEHNRWHVRINVNNKRTYVGIYDTIEEAREARLAAVKERIAELEAHQKTLPSASARLS